MKDFAAAVGAVIGIIFAIFGAFALTAILNGWVLSILWGWFAVPTFGLPALSIPSAIGVALVVSYLTYQYIPDRNSDEDSAGRSISFIIARPFIALFIGWIVQMFM